MPPKESTADRIIRYLKKKGVSIFLDGSGESDSARIGTPFTYYDKDKILTIFLVNLKGTTKEKIMPVLREKWSEIGILMKKSSEETLESYISYVEQRTNTEIIDFFKDKIPSADFDVLKMSLFLLSHRGQDVNLFKQQIRERFGERGTYITNLCNSGYFENDFMPYYEIHPVDFERYYELSVGRELKAIFVHAGMTSATLADILEKKLIVARRFQVKSFKIHGFGSWNVELIKTVLQDYQNSSVKNGGDIEVHKIVEEPQPPSVIYEITILPFSEYL
jgi:hypothetical protein